MSTTITRPHVLVYPYAYSGHVIPLVDLTRRLLTHSLTITFVVTPVTLPLLEPLLSTYPSSSFQPLLLSVPENMASVAYNPVASLRYLGENDYPALLHWFQSHPSPPVAIISDFFLPWAQDLGVPRLVFFPSGALHISVDFSTWNDLRENDEPDDVNSRIVFPNVPNSPVYPWWQIDIVYRTGREGDSDWEYYRSLVLGNRASWGAVFNSFAELEGVYFDHIKKVMGHDRVWAVGPALPPDDDVAGYFARGGSSSLPPHEVMTWLDAREVRSVVFVCFGSRVSLTSVQMEVLTDALEHSGVHFILAVRKRNEEDVGDDHGEISDGYEDRVANRGLVIKGWAPQMVILRHRAVGAFLTHCGWNSLIEGLVAGKVMLTWPIDTDQFSNAKLLVDQLGVGIRVCEGPKMVPESAELARLLVESLHENKPERVRAKELSEAALGAVNGGSSDKDLDELVKRLDEL